MKKLQRLGIGLGFILVGISGTVQAQTVYNSLWSNNLSSLQIKEYDNIERQLENRSHIEPPPPPPLPGHTGSKSNDFNGDGKADILWHSEMGDVVIWFMDGAAGHGATIATGIPQAWSIVGTADFNGDGKADILWRSSCGPGAIFFMNGANIISGAAIKNVSLKWNIVPGPKVNPLDCPSG